MGMGLSLTFAMVTVLMYNACEKEKQVLVSSPSQATSASTDQPPPAPNLNYYTMPVVTSLASLPAAVEPSS